MNILKIVLFFAVFVTAAFSAPAINRTITFTQPDGTRFKGHLKGDSSFHWIESNGDIVVYNPQDKYYYKAIADKEKGLIITTQKAINKSNEYMKNSLNAVNRIKKEISQSDRESLYILYKKSKTINHPR